VITVLADAAEFAEEIDVERARAALRRAEEQLKDLSPSVPEFVEAQATLRRAEVRIRVAGR
jgi:F-type H+-transporting ATPase subunit epsilon